MISLHYAELSASDRAQLNDAGIAVIKKPVTRYELTDRKILAHIEGQAAPLAFDVIYPALGVRPRSELAIQLGIAVDDCGCLDATTPFETQVPGLYSGGDVVEGLDQLNVAMAHGAIAATKAHNWLRERDGEALADQSVSGSQERSAA